MNTGSAGGIGSEGTKEPILVVDDDPALRSFFRSALEQAGFATVEAPSGEDALRVVAARSLAAVLLDVHLSGVTGLEVVRRLRARPETATLPILLVTGSSTTDLVVDALGAGATDFLTKPVRLDELIARVRAMIRSDRAWAERLQTELTARSSVVEGLGRLPLVGTPEEVARDIVAELAAATKAEFIALHRVVGVGELRLLAVYRPATGVQTTPWVLEPRLARDLLERAERGPWIDYAGRDMFDKDEGLARISVAAAARAPIYALGRLAGLLVLGYDATDAAGRPVVVPQSKLSQLLAATIDYASILSALAGEAIAGDPQAIALRTTLREVLNERAFRPVFQPIVKVSTGAVIGYEALTRFDDGTRPDVRLDQANAAGLGYEYEAAMTEAAVSAAASLPVDAFLALNASPGFVMLGRHLRDLVSRAAQPVVLEITEHARIEDYSALRAALRRFAGKARFSVDDAGAGYASLRHILELEPDFAKLDMSIVRGIEHDTVRQSLVAGLQYFAEQTHCQLIAEGVETAAEAETLKRLGVELAQGFHYGVPAAIDVPIAVCAPA